MKWQRISPYCIQSDTHSVCCIHIGDRPPLYEAWRLGDGKRQQATYIDAFDSAEAAKDASTNPQECST